MCVEGWFSLVMEDSLMKDLNFYEKVIKGEKKDNTAEGE